MSPLGLKKKLSPKYPSLSSFHKLHIEAHTVSPATHRSGGGLQLFIRRQNSWHSFTNYHMAPCQARAQEESGKGHSCRGTADSRTKSQLPRICGEVARGIPFGITILTFENHLLCQKREDNSKVPSRGSAQSHIFAPHYSMHIF